VTERGKSLLMNAILMAVVFLAVILVGARVLGMTLGEVGLAIVAGAIGGLGVLALILWNTRTGHA
jgi:hypothetical protein